MKILSIPCPCLRLAWGIIWGLIAFGCTSPAGAPDAASPDRAQRPGYQFQVTDSFEVPVQGELAVHDYLPQQGLYVATLRPEQMVLRFEQGGRLRDHALAEGQYVQAGDLLAVLDETPHQLALQRAELAMLEAEQQKQILLIEHNYDSLPPPAHKERAFDLQSGYLQAELDLREARYRLRQCTLRAPYAGRLSAVQVKAQQLVAASDPLATLTADRALWVRAHVLPQELAVLEPGQTAQVEVPSRPAEPLSAILREIDPSVNAEGLVAINLRLTGQPARVYPGMYAQVRMILPGPQAYPLVPVSALLERDGKAVVLVYEQGRALWRRVQPGRQSEQAVEILDGLQPGETVLTQGHLHLSHQARVIPR